MNLLTKGEDEQDQDSCCCDLGLHDWN